MKFYGAYLINHAARAIVLTGNRKKRNGWYAGIYCKREKVSVDVNYQVVEAQAIPDFDVSGIGTGNPRANLFYGPARDDFTGAPVVVTQLNANGNVNYKGWSAQLLYLLTKHISLQLEGKWSRNEDRSIGPNRSFRTISMTAIFHW